MKIPKLNILDEKNKTLRAVSKPVVFPLTKEDQKLIADIELFLKVSQIEETRNKYDLRAGMGLAFIQLGIPKRIFVIVYEEEDGSFTNYVFINPKIISQSEELIYVGEGEGCLSVNRPTIGIVPRHARVTVETADINGQIKTLRLREDLAIALQHEIDHLNGILFVDKIDSQDPFKDRDKMREI